ncbi:hypothetical protein CapIbe_005455 [Capra ibex]
MLSSRSHSSKSSTSCSASLGTQKFGVFWRVELLNKDTGILACPALIALCKPHRVEEMLVEPSTSERAERWNCTAVELCRAVMFVLH